MTINVCTCITSFVERVMRLGVEKRPISSIEKDCTLPKSLARTVPPNPVAIRAAHTAVATDASKLPREPDLADDERQRQGGKPPFPFR